MFVMSAEQGRADRAKGDRNSRDVLPARIPTINLNNYLDGALVVVLATRSSSWRTGKTVKNHMCSEGKSRGFPLVDFPLG